MYKTKETQDNFKFTKVYKGRDRQVQSVIDGSKKETWKAVRYTYTCYKGRRNYRYSTQNTPNNLSLQERKGERKTSPNNHKE